MRKLAEQEKIELSKFDDIKKKYGKAKVLQNPNFQAEVFGPFAEEKLKTLEVEEKNGTKR